MQTGKPDIQFRHVKRTDFDLLRSWMEAPHMRKWWGEPGVELGYIRDMIEGRDTTKPYIFQVGGVDAGYIQYWIVADQMFEPWLTKAPWMLELPKNAIGVDLSIGNAKMLGKGLGTCVLKKFVTHLRGLGFTEITIDPDPNNKRAVRAYEKVGFRAIESLLGKTGDSLIMRHEG